MSALCVSGFGSGGMRWGEGGGMAGLDFVGWEEESDGDLAKCGIE